MRTAGLGLGITGVVLAATTVFAQPAQPTIPAKPTTPTEDVEVAPIECWWKTDRSGVRVGEHFALTLTCAVIDTDRVRVVVDESTLAPSALHLTPFEVVEGERFRDIDNEPRKFFQYRYTVRVLGEDVFGQEIPLPKLEISYRVQNALQGGAGLLGRETKYSLNPVPIRVLSLVPAGRTDLRDTPLETFGDVEARLFRSNVLFILSVVAFVIAGLLGVMVLARAAVKRRGTAIQRKRTIAPLTALRAASRELGAVQSASQGEGWTSDLAGRAAAALRLAGAVALARPVTHRELDRDMEIGEGQVAAVPLFPVLRGKRTVLSATITPDTGGLNGTLKESLATFTAARYARNGKLDGPSLDAALAEGQDAVKRVRTTQLMRLGRRTRRAETAAVRQTWAR